jgi:mitotic-spindle organizing protein 1
MSGTPADTSAGTRGDANKGEQHRRVLDTVGEISDLLNTSLTNRQLAYCVSLLDKGVNPEALAVCTSYYFDTELKLNDENYRI